MHLSEKEVYEELISTQNIKKDVFLYSWQQLSASEKEIYYLKYAKGLDYDEIITHLKLLTPKQEFELDKAKKKLRKYIR